MTAGQWAGFAIFSILGGLIVLAVTRAVIDSHPRKSRRPR